MSYQRKQYVSDDCQVRGTVEEICHLLIHGILFGVSSGEIQRLLYFLLLLADKVIFITSMPKNAEVIGGCTFSSPISPQSPSP